MTGILMNPTLLTMFVVMIIFLGWVGAVGYWTSSCLKKRKRGEKYSKDTGIIKKGLMAKRRIKNKTLDLVLDKRKINKFWY